MTKRYVTLQLSTGYTIIGQVEESIVGGYYTVHMPLKPIVLNDGESTKVQLVSMNPFSDATKYKIHDSHIVSIGELDVTYIDLYNDSVNRIEAEYKKKFTALFTPVGQTANIMESREQPLSVTDAELSDRILH